MATKYDVIQRPGVQLKYDDPMSGWEALASALGEYADPQYQLQLKRDRREDARVHLAGKRFDELQEQNDLAEARQKKNDRINAQNAEQQKTTFDQAQEDRKFNLEKENYDTVINELTTAGDLEGLTEYLDNFTTGNPRLSAIAKNRERLLSRKRSQLDSAVEDLVTLAPGLMEKYKDTNALRALLFKDHNAIANQIMLGEIGEITQGKEREYEARKSILAAQIEQLKLTLPGSQARIDLTSAMNRTIEGIRKYGGIEVPAGGGGDPFGDIEDQYDIERTGTTNIPSGIADYVSLVSQDSPDTQGMISGLAPRGELGIMEEAAKEGSVLVPVTKEVRKAVKGSLMDLRKGMSSVSDFNRYGTPEKARESESYKRSVNSLKNSLVNAINLYNSIDPKSGRGGKGGQSERNKIKKQIMDLKKRATRSKFISGSIKHFDPEFLEMLEAISFEGKPSKKSKKKSRAKKVMIAGPENPLDLLLDLSEPADSTEDIPEMWLEPATEGVSGVDSERIVPFYD